MTTPRFSAYHQVIYFVSSPIRLAVNTRTVLAFVPPQSCEAILGPPQTRVKKQETRIKKQNGLAHLRFLVCVTPKQKNNA